MLSLRKKQLLRLQHTAEQQEAELEHRLLESQSEAEISAAIEQIASLQLSLGDLTELIRLEPPETRLSPA